MPRTRARKRNYRPRGEGQRFTTMRRGQLIYVARVIVGKRGDGKPKYVTRSATTQEELQEKVRAITPPGPATTVGEWAARWLSESEGKVRDNTVNTRRVSVEHHINPTLGAIRVCELTPQHVETAAATWADGHKVNYVRSILAHLHTCMQEAARSGLRKDNPVKLARKPRGEKTRIDPLSPQDLNRLIALAQTKANWRILALLAATGCRVGEAMALDYDDYNPQKGTISITKTFTPTGIGPPKTRNSRRTITVPKSARKAIVLAMGKRKTGPAFLTDEGNRANPGFCRYAMVTILEELSLPFRNIHQLRHSVATAMLSAGVPPGDVAVYLGDTPETIVRTYLHASGVDVCAAMENILTTTKAKSQKKA